VQGYANSDLDILRNTIVLKAPIFSFRFSMPYFYEPSLDANINRKIPKSLLVSYGSSVCLAVCLSAHLSFRLSVCQFDCLSVCLSASQSVCPFIRLPFCLSIYLLICPSVHLSVYLSVCLYICSSVCMSLCPSVFCGRLIINSSIFSFISLFVRPTSHMSVHLTNHVCPSRQPSLLPS
jgi:hypothetical protein